MIVTGTMRGGKIESDTDINVTKDATVGRKIILQDRNKETQGYEEAGMMSVDTGVMLISALYNRIIQIQTGGNIDLNCSSCRVNGKTVATQADLDELQERIFELEKKIANI